MLVNFYGVRRLLLSIWGIGMVCEGLYTCMGNSVVAPQNPAGAGRKMKHKFLVFAPWFPVFKRSTSDGINLVLWNTLRCSDKNKHKNGSDATMAVSLISCAPLWAVRLQAKPSLCPRLCTVRNPDFIVLFTSTGLLPAECTQPEKSPPEGLALLYLGGSTSLWWVVEDCWEPVPICQLLCGPYGCGGSFWAAPSHSSHQAQPQKKLCLGQSLHQYWAESRLEKIKVSFASLSLWRSRLWSEVALLLSCLSMETVWAPRECALVPRVKCFRVWEA